ncbi:MAG: hypothetical protein ACR2QM_13120 [Longimicrobiales bacterium]
MRVPAAVGALCVITLACAGAGQERFASPVAPLAGCYVFEYGPWPDGAEEAWEDIPDPSALPAVLELTTARVGETDEAAVGGRIHEVRSHGIPGRGVLHFWRMVDSDSIVVSTGGPVGFRLDVRIQGQTASGTTSAFASGDVRTAPLSGLRTPCPRQAPIGRGH